MQPVKRLVSGVRISQFDFSNGRGGVPHSKMPVWIPHAVKLYLAHTEHGHSIRSLARYSGVHPSTVSRSVRKIETLRDDPLIDRAVQELSKYCLESAPRRLEDKPMSFHNPDPNPLCYPASLDTPSITALRYLARKNTVLALAQGLELAVIVREAVQGQVEKLGTLDRAQVMAMTMQDWLKCDDPQARIMRFHLTDVGLKLLARLEEADTNAAEGREGGPSDPVSRGRLRYGQAISPVHALARRRNKDGEPYISRSLVKQAERLREDYELALLESNAPIDWLGAIRSGLSRKSQAPAASALYRARSALADLGPGLGDVALRCCCRLEGLEAVEQTMGWSARSGKIVLRIALQRLARHYEDTQAAEALVG